MTEPTPHPGELGDVRVRVTPTLRGVAEQMFADGAAAARQFAAGFHTFTGAMGDAGRAGGQAFASGVVPHLQQVSQHLHGNVLAAGALGGAFSVLAEKAAEGFGEIVESGEEVVKKFIEIGDTFEEVSRTLEVHTTAMGADLEGLKDTVSRVAETTSAKLGDIATATANLAQRTGLRGGALDQLVRDFVDAQKLLGQPIDVNAFIGSMHALNVPMNQADDYLTKLFNISRETNVPLQQLVETVGKNATAFAQFHIDALPAATLMAQMTTHGIDAQGVLKGLQSAAAAAAKEHKPLAQFIRETVEQMDNFRRTGKETAENNLAERVFSKKGALEFKQAVDQGILSGESLNTVLEGTAEKTGEAGESISGMYEKTKTLDDVMQELHNSISVALGPAAETVVHSFAGALGNVGDWVKTHGAEIIGWVHNFGDVTMQVGQVLTQSFGYFAEIVGAMLHNESLVQLGHTAVEAAKGIAQMIPQFDNLMDNAQKSQHTVDLLNQAIEKTSDGKGLQLKANSGEVLQQLDQLGIKISQAPGGKLNIEVDTPENQERVQKFLTEHDQKDKFDVKVVPRPQLPGGGDYHGDPKTLFPGTDGTIPIKIKPEIDTSDIPGWLKTLMGGIGDAFAPDTPENREKYKLPSIHDPLPTGPAQTPNAGPDNDRDAKRAATRDYAKAHGDRMPPGTAKWLDGTGPIPPELAPFYHPQHHQAGGTVPGFGDGDHVPALLEPGEWIAPRWMVNKYGRILEQIRVRGFAEGGHVGAWFGATKHEPEGPTTENIARHFAHFKTGGVVGGILGGFGLDVPSFDNSSIYPPGANVVTEQQKAAEEYAAKQREAARAVERATDRVEDLANAVEDDRDKITDLTKQYEDAEGDEQEQAKIAKELARARQKLARDTRDHAEAEEDAQTAKQKQAEATEVTPKKGEGGSNEEIGAAMGKGLIQGIFQELGFPDVFGKPITDWTITKLLGGGLGFGLEQLLRGHAPQAHAGSGAAPGPGGGTAGFPIPTPRLLPTGPQEVSPFGVHGWPIGPGNKPGDVPAPPTQAHASGVDWDAIAGAESNGNWSITYGEGPDVTGGLQIATATWLSHGGGQYAPKAYMAKKEQQIAVAENILNDPSQGPGAWPTTYRNHPQWFGRSGTPPAGPQTETSAFNSVPNGGGGGFGAAAGDPTVPPPDENAIRTWVQQNFGIPNTFGTGSWENRAHDYDGGWHHRGLHGATVPSGYGFDFHGTPEQMDALANWIADNDLQNTLELIHQGPGFDTRREIKNAKYGDVYGAALNAEHRDHVHWAVAAPPWAQDGVPDAQQVVPPSQGGGGPQVAVFAPVVNAQGQQQQSRQPYAGLGDMVADAAYEAATNQQSPFSFRGDGPAVGGLGPMFDNFIAALPNQLVKWQDQANPSSPSKLAGSMQAARPEDNRRYTAGGGVTNFNINQQGVMSPGQAADKIRSVAVRDAAWKGPNQMFATGMQLA